jgi:sugar phosphate permease
MSEALQATPRVKSIQRAAVVMLVAAGVINYIDRATLSVANPLIRQDLGLSIADMGYLLSAFLWAYAFAQLPTGAMVDRLGPRILLTLGLSLWSCAQLLGGRVQGFGQFFAARLLLGVGGGRSSRPACAWRGTGSIQGIAGWPQASLSLPRPSATPSPFRC